MNQNEFEQDDTSYCDRQRLDRILGQLIRSDRVVSALKTAAAPSASAGDKKSFSMTPAAMTTTWCEPATPEGRPAPMDWEAILLHGTVHLFGYPSVGSLERD